MTFDDAHAYLLALPRFADQGAAALHPGLARMAALMDALGQPHRAVPSVQVAGTNGKGSTASMLAAIATASGRRVGLHTSPHLRYVGERLRLDGVPAPPEWIAGAVARFRPALDAIEPSFFEATTALSFRYFAEQAVDLAVVEVGLGGRLDATTILHPRLSLITSIGLDHTDLLGTTLAEIAREKAGIIKPGVPVLTAVAPPDAEAAIRAVAEAQHAPLHRLRDEVTVTHAATTCGHLTLTLDTPVHHYADLVVDLPGLHQQTNAGLAVRAAELLFDAGGGRAEAVYAGLRDVRRLAGLRGRLEVLQQHPLIVADVAHNPDGLAAALAFMRAQAPHGQLYVLLGLLHDKDAAAMARLLADAHATVLPVGLQGARALSRAALTAVLQAHGLATLAAEQVADGLAWFRQHAADADALLITGSHHVVAETP